MDTAGVSGETIASLRQGVFHGKDELACAYLAPAVSDGLVPAVTWIRNFKHVSSSVAQCLSCSYPPLVALLLWWGSEAR